MFCVLASKQINAELDYEIEELLTELSNKNRDTNTSLKQRLETLRTLKPSFDKKLYLKELLKLKDQFST